ncbi:MAG: glycosyltransferase [Candidatus Hydrogenedentota bacterium]
MSRLKILHVYKDFEPPIHGGMERHIALMCRFQREWADVEALTCSRKFGTRVVDRDGTQVTEVGELGRFQSAPASPLFPFYMRKMKADVMMVHVPNPTAELGWLMTRPRGKLVVRYHSDVIRQAAAMKIYRPFQQALLARADVIIPTSQNYLDTSESLAPFRDKCEVISLGILPEDFESPREDLVSEYRTRYGERFVFFGGRHRYYKGLHVLVEAAQRIDMPIVIAGDGPERERLEKQTRDLGVKVHFPGTLSDEEMVAHLHACSLVAFPSIERSEAFGISIMEAHVCRKPVVATKLGTGVEFINVDAETGLNVPVGDARAFADAVNRLMQNDELRLGYGEHARDRIIEQFDARHVARLEYELVRGLVDDK